jgi:hypothetical protein
VVEELENIKQNNGREKPVERGLRSGPVVLKRRGSTLCRFPQSNLESFKASQLICPRLFLAQKMGSFGVLIRHQLPPGFLAYVELVGFIWTTRAEQSAELRGASHRFDVGLITVTGRCAPQGVFDLAAGALDCWDSNAVYRGQRSFMAGNRSVGSRLLSTQASAPASSTRHRI